MEKKKMTKKDMFGEIKAVALEIGREDLVAFAEREIELLERKSSRASQSKTKIANDKIRASIVELLTEIAKPVTITEMQELSEEMASYSNQKISALLAPMVESGVIVRTKDKKKTYFSIAE